MIKQSKLVKNEIFSYMKNIKWIAELINYPFSLLYIINIISYMKNI